MTKPEKSSFQIDNYTITKSLFEIKKENYSVPVIYSLSLSKQISDVRCEKEICFGKVELKISVDGRAGRTIPHKVRIDIVGEFRGEYISKSDFEKFCEINGVANLLLIARSYISSTTSQMGINPIVIPLVNLLSTNWETK